MTFGSYGKQRFELDGRTQRSCDSIWGGWDCDESVASVACTVLPYVPDIPCPKPLLLTVVLQLLLLVSKYKKGRHHTVLYPDPELG
jgi:hypothetical protein